MSSQKLRDFLKNIGREDWSWKGYSEKYLGNGKINAIVEPMGSKDWLRFARTGMIESINDSKVNPKSGMSNEEMLEYLKSSYIPNSEFDDDDDWLIY
jgi:hypothetical protein